MKRPPEQTGLRERGNVVTFMTEYGHVTAIVDEDVLFSASADPKPILTISQFTQFYAAVMALHREQTKEKE